MIALLLVDNVNDFTHVFRKMPLNERTAAVDKFSDDWGKRFIVFPNPAYGEWEGAVYQSNWGVSAAEKDKMREEKVKPWDDQP